MIPPVEFLKALRESDGYIETIYTEGGCYQLYLLLSKLYPDVEPVKDADLTHVGSLIGGIVYDINGIVDWDWYPMWDSDIEIAQNWSFSNHKYLSLGECTFCEEPLLV